MFDRISLSLSVCFSVFSCLPKLLMLLIFLQPANARFQFQAFLFPSHYSENDVVSVKLSLCATNVFKRHIYLISSVLFKVLVK